MIRDIPIKTEKEQHDELVKISIERDIRKFGRDGILEIGSKDYEHRGIKYTIKILRYFTLDPNIFKPMGSNRYTDMHAVVEHPDETKELASIMCEVGQSDFLYHDTLHSFNDKQTIEEQVDLCHRWAKSDIDNVNSSVIEWFDNNLKKIYEIEKKMNVKLIDRIKSKCETKNGRT